MKNDHINWRERTQCKQQWHVQKEICVKASTLFRRFVESTASFHTNPLHEKEWRFSINLWGIATNRWFDYSRSLTTSFSSSIKVKNRVRLINRCQYMVSRMTKAQIGCNDTLALSISRIFNAKLTTPVTIVDRSGNEKNIMRQKSRLELSSSSRSMPINFCNDRFTLRINIFSTEFWFVVSTFDALMETTERNDTQNSPIYRDKHIACDKLFAVIWEKLWFSSMDWFHGMFGYIYRLDKQYANATMELNYVLSS